MERIMTIEKEMTNILNTRFRRSSGFLLLLFFFAGFFLFINTIASSAYFTTFEFPKIQDIFIE
jgi:hypothetical protein